MHGMTGGKSAAGTALCAVRADAKGELRLFRLRAADSGTPRRMPGIVMEGCRLVLVSAGPVAATGGHEGAEDLIAFAREHGLYGMLLLREEGGSALPVGARWAETLREGEAAALDKLEADTAAFELERRGGVLQAAE